MTPIEQAEADLEDAREDFCHRAQTVQRELDRAMRDIAKGIPPAIPSDSFVQVERKAVEIRLLRDHLAVLQELATTPRGTS